MKQKIADLFQQIHGREPSTITRAPGRIEFIGNHTDYNGGTVLGASVDRGVTVAIAPRTLNLCNSPLSSSISTLFCEAAVEAAATAAAAAAGWTHSQHMR
jgi:galactokinase